MSEYTKNFRPMQYVSAVLAALGATTAATYSVWPSPSLSKLQSETDSPIGRPITDAEGSWVVSLYRLAIIPGSILCAWLVEKFGRKNTLIISGIMLFIPWVMIRFATSIEILYTARFICGLGSSFALVTCTIYNSEIAENDIRGRLTTTIMILKLSGALLVLSLGPYISYNSLAVLLSLIPIVFVCAFLFMPETPYYLIKTNRREKAEKALRLLCSKQADEEFVNGRLAEIENCVETDMKNKTTVWEFLSNKNYRTAIFLIAGIKALQQLNGQSAIDAYMEHIIALTDSNISHQMSSIIFGVVQLPAAFLSSILVDRLGRRPLLLISAAGCTIALFGEGLYFYLHDVMEADVSSIKWLPTVCIALYLIMNPIGIFTLPFVLMGELFPTNIRGIAVSVSVVYSSVLAFLVTKFFKPVANTFGVYVVFWFFAGVCVLGGIFVEIFLPETKGKTFNEIQSILNKNRNDKKTEEKYETSLEFAYI